MSNKEEIAKLLQKIADLEEADKQFEELFSCTTNCHTITLQGMS
jgi:hypothetical protein